MHYSDLPLRYKLVCLAALAAVIWVWSLVVKTIVYDWMPEWLVGYVLTAMLALAIGAIIGERSAIKAIQSHRDDDRSSADL